MRIYLKADRSTRKIASVMSASALTLAAMISAALAQTESSLTPPSVHMERSPGTTSTLPAPVFFDRQRDGEIRAANVIGVTVSNKSNDVIGTIVDVVFKADGQVSSIVIGVGGLLGLGEKNVAVPYDAIAIATDKDSIRTARIDAQLSTLQAAPAYVSERTTFEKVQDGIAALAKEAQKKATEFKNNMSAPALGRVEMILGCPCPPQMATG